MISNTKRVVIKVGTSTLTNENGSIKLRVFDQLALIISDLHNLGYEIILVTSGAIAVGLNDLGFLEKPDSIQMQQAAAAVGQNRLMSYYSKFFHEYNKNVAQILLAADDLNNEEKTENLINTFDALLQQGIIPIVNENDSVSYTEIESEERLFGDNDLLSAIVAVLVDADLLVIFSDIDGFYDSDPRLHPNAKLIERIDEISEEIVELAGGAGSRRGTGGMRTKLRAAQLATKQGIDTVITNGKKPRNLYEVLKNRKAGTLFTGQEKEF